MKYLLFIFLFMFASFAAAQSGTDALLTASVVVTTPDTVSVGGTFTAQVRVEDIPSIAGYTMKIAFTPGMLEATELVRGPFSQGSYWLTSVISNSTATISNILWIRLSSGGTGSSGELFTIKFKAKTPGTATVCAKEVLLISPIGMEVPVSIINAEIAIVAYPPWDVNQDGTVNMIDLILVGQYFGQRIIGNPTPNPDVNRDGYANIYDIIIVVKHLPGFYAPGAPARNPVPIVQYRKELVDIYNIVTKDPVHDADAIAILEELVHRATSMRCTTWGAIRSR